MLPRDDEAWLFDNHTTPLTTASMHAVTDPVHIRKLLLYKRELGKLFGAIQQRGYVCAVLSMYWKKYLVKCEIVPAKGKKDLNKHHTEKKCDFDREIQRTMRHGRDN